VRLRTWLLVIAAIGGTAIGLVTYWTSALNALELNTVDARFAVRGAKKPPKNIVMVEIDSKTFNDLNYLWPFPRVVDGKVLQTIENAHPKAVAFDVQTSEPSPCPGGGKNGQCTQAQQDELAFLTALNNDPGRTVLSTTETNAQGNARLFGSDGDALLAQVGSRFGNGGFPTDTNGDIRRLAYKVDALKSLSVVTAEIAGGHPFDHRKFEGKTQWIDFYGPAGTIPSVSFSDVYNGKVASSFFANKIVVVGPSASNLQDIHPTPTSAGMPGVEVQANAVATVLRGLPLRWAPTWLDVLMILVLGLTAPLASIRISRAWAATLGIGLGIAYTIGVQVAFNHGLVMAYVYPMLALALSGVAALGVHLMTEAFERVRVHDLFSRFVPEDVVGQVLAETGGELRLGGVEREATVMFTDLRGFTSFAESLTPEQVIEVLNHYLSEMSDEILDHGGTLVAYMGDGIMAVFGAPIASADHADRALATARAMLNVRLPRFNRWLREESLHDHGFRMGIGLNSGRVMSGNVGSERRVEYTAVGDTTNSASRIEALTKGTPHQLFLADTTKVALREPPSDLVFVDDFQLRGRESKTRIWSLVADGAGTPASADRPEPEEAAPATRISAPADEARAAVSAAARRRSVVTTPPPEPTASADRSTLVRPAVDLDVDAGDEAR
jgi:adenylate cyclase